MGVTEFLHSLGLENNFVPHNKIRIVTMWQNHALIGHFTTFFPTKRNVRATQFNHKSIFINDFIMTSSEFAMNFHTKTNELKNFFFVKQFAH